MQTPPVAEENSKKEGHVDQFALNWGNIWTRTPTNYNVRWLIMCVWQFTDFITQRIKLRNSLNLNVH